MSLPIYEIREPCDLRVNHPEIDLSDLEHQALMAQLVEYRMTSWEVAGLNPDQTSTQGLKITEKKVLPLFLHLQMVRLSSLLG